MTYTINYLTRGPDWGFHLTRTPQNSYGDEFSIGLNLGLNHFDGNPKDMFAKYLEGKTITISGSSVFGSGNINLGYGDNGGILWSGASAGIGIG